MNKKQPLSQKQKNILNGKLLKLAEQLSLLKKCIAVFCVLIIALNAYHIRRLHSDSSKLRDLMSMYKKTKYELSMIENRHLESNKNFIQKRSVYKRVPGESFVKSLFNRQIGVTNPSRKKKIKKTNILMNLDPEIEQKLGDPLRVSPDIELQTYREMMRRLIKKSKENYKYTKIPVEEIVGGPESNSAQKNSMLYFLLNHLHRL